MADSACFHSVEKKEERGGGEKEKEEKEKLKEEGWRDLRDRLALLPRTSYPYSIAR